ncbi:MAG: putative nucleotide-diphospho-sugar transferase [Kiritimatiellae bacterium]|nr:putative nucleotide-diphospho-sugar transferase [Kiritimatiellia bacterium]
MKLYILTSESHTRLLNEWFLPSIEDDFELVRQDSSQICSDGRYMASGFVEMMIKKVDLILRAIEENPSRVFIYSDVDVQFFCGIESDIAKLMDGMDMLIIKDSPRGVMCPGFFAGRGSDAFRDLWLKIRERLEQSTKYHDQDVLNDLLLGRAIACSVTLSRALFYLTSCYVPVLHYRSLHNFGVRWGYLPPRYYCYGADTWRRWKPGRPVHLPDPIFVHHANWVSGVQGKFELMDAVRKKVCAK